MQRAYPLLVTLPVCGAVLSPVGEGFKAEAAFLTPAPVRRLAAVRIATGAFLLNQLWNNYANFAQIARTAPAQWSPVGPLVWWDGPLPPDCSTCGMGSIYRPGAGTGGGGLDA